MLLDLEQKTQELHEESEVAVEHVDFLSHEVGGLAGEVGGESREGLESEECLVDVGCLLHRAQWPVVHTRNVSADDLLDQLDEESLAQQLVLDG